MNEENRTPVSMEELVSFGVLRESNITEKLTTEHIDKYLDGARESMNKLYQERRDEKVFLFLITSVTLFFLFVLTLLLKDTPSLLEKVVYSIASFAAGAFGGYGFGRRKQTTNED